MTKSTVYFGSPRQARLSARETLPAKLDLIINQLHIRERVKGETVALKMHLGNNLSYSVIHPVFVRKVVQAVEYAEALGLGNSDYELVDVLPVEQAPQRTAVYIAAH
jgi:uncharacterized Fe-S center protein